MTVNLDEEEYVPDMDKPVMRIGAVAELLGVCPRMVRIYEERGLVRPHRKNNQRLYSFNDVCWLGRLRQLINEEDYGIGEIERMIALPACWKLVNCSADTRDECPVANRPGKRCWEIARETGKEQQCENCQIYRIGMELTSEE